VGKYMSIVTAGCGMAAVSLLLFAGCEGSGGENESPGIPGSDITTTQPNSAEETLNTAGPSEISIPGVDPPTRPSTSVTDANGCSMRGVTCEPTTSQGPTEDSWPPSSDVPEPRPAETGQSPG
jgi:hypothetical protein